LKLAFNRYCLHSTGLVTHPSIADFTANKLAESFFLSAINRRGFQTPRGFQMI
jgi:hypothetical protein